MSVVWAQIRYRALIGSLTEFCRMPQLSSFSVSSTSKQWFFNLLLLFDVFRNNKPTRMTNSLHTGNNNWFIWKSVRLHHHYRENSTMDAKTFMWRRYPKSRLHPLSSKTGILSVLRPFSIFLTIRIIFFYEFWP